MSIYFTDTFLLELSDWMKSNPFTKEELEEIKRSSTLKVPGTPHSQEFKDSARLRMMGNKNTLGLKCNPLHVAARAKSICRKVEIDGVIYTSGVEAARTLGVSRSLIVKWIKSGKANKV